MKKSSLSAGMQTKEKSLVTVICTCYNQAEYVVQALESLVSQTYRPIELLIVDNGSKDHSKSKIISWVKENCNEIPIKAFFHEKKMNYCKAFNQAFANSEGEYIVDLAADDFFEPKHLEFAISHLNQSDAKVYFCNSLEHFPNGETQTFYPTDAFGKASKKVASGDVFAELIRRYAISSPTLVMDAGAFREIGCYDENLNYEDFDILVRMSSKYSFVYGDHITVNKRILQESLSQQQYRSKKSQLLPSTYLVCEKLATMVTTKTEKKALQQRLIHEIKHATASANFDVAQKMLTLYRKLFPFGLSYMFFYLWTKAKIDVSAMYEKWRLKHFK
ncbi:glycosyltransferase family 2 protein [Cyclobacterium marinum]|uniref:Glycosyl transferase family 2 n=1 Tax=Cyclobacterium marinum (strain ATCC 25205 / DSM 745 / LMG 13164 / NCIMB 1802) TaxID=880070 RepID=G0IWS3_CYCMS|nr:glycosyltransferase [Cyclobacterium marinum]AEL24265.1 glycosyl transferase family 2 [Cyclobacterium marinum DSM 745]